MKKLIAVLTVAVALLALSVPAQSQVRIGPKLGVEVNTLRFSGDMFDRDNRAGFTGGLMIEAMVPGVGLGIDVSVMYVRRNQEALSLMQGYESVDVAKDYINVPVNLKWRLGLPLVGKIITPYVFTGPDFAFLTSRRAINAAWRNKSVDVAWNVGAGVQLFSHVQVGASYGFGITKLSRMTGLTGNDAPNIQGKNSYWTVTAAYLF